MNKIFKVIWNVATQSFVVVSELTKAKGKENSSCSTTNQTQKEKITSYSLSSFALSTITLAMMAVLSVDAKAAINDTSNGSNILIGIGNSRANTLGNNVQNATAIGGRSIVTSGSVAVGNNAKAEGDQAIAIGADTIASGSSSIAIGGDDLNNASKTNIDGTMQQNVNDGSVNTRFREIAGINLVDPTNVQTQYPATNASGAASVAVGVQSIASGHLSTAFGTKTLASGIAATALGVAAKATGAGSFAGGPNANATGIQAIAIGADSDATSENAAAIGKSANAGNTNTIAIGYLSNATSANATAIGANATASNTSTIALGNNATASQVNATAIGANATANNTSTIALGDNATASRVNATAIGANATASNTSTIAIGDSANASRVKATAIGANATANNTSTIALGDNATANGANSAAIGLNTTATNTNATAFGSNATANGLNTIAIGSSAFANMTSALAIGYQANASSNNTTAIGRQAKATAVNATALGVRANAIANDTIAIGTNSTANATNATVIGMQANASTNAVDAIAIGRQANVSNSSSIAIGSVARAMGVNATAIGIQANATNTSAVAIGDAARATGQNATALGKNANATNTSTIAIGTNANASRNQAIAIGENAIANQTQALAIGVNATARIQGAMAFGLNANSSGSNSTAFGMNAAASGSNSTAIGTNAVVSGDRSLVIGYNASSQAGGGSSAPFNTIVIGYNASTNASSAVVMGQNANATGGNTVTIGTDAKTTAGNSVAIGYNACATNTNAVAIGQAARTSKNGSVILGSSSSDSASILIANTTDAVINGITYNNFSGSILKYNENTDNEEKNKENRTKNQGHFVSIGSNSNGGQRKLTNLAAGNISATSTEAINGSQLYSIISTLDNTYFHVNTGKADQVAGNADTNLGSILSKAGATGNYSLTAGVNAKASGVNATAIGYTANASGENAIAMGVGVNATGANSTAIGRNITATTANSIVLGNASDGGATFQATSGATVNNIQYTNFAGTNTSAGVLSIGSRGAERQIKHVAAGRVNSSSTDAINGSQLYAVMEKIKTVDAGGLKTIAVSANSANEQTLTADNNGKTTINFVNGTGTTASIENNAVKFDVNTDNQTININNNGKLEVSTSIINQATDKLFIPQSNAANNKLVNVSTVIGALNKVSFNVATGYTTGGASTGTVGEIKHSKGLTLTAGSGVNLTASNSNGNGTIQIDVNASMLGSGKLTVNAGKVTAGFVEGGANEDWQLVNSTTVANAINNASFIVKASNTTGGIVSGTENKHIKAGDTLNLTAGKNIDITQSGSTFTFKTKDDVTFSNVTVNNNITTANLTASNSIQVGSIAITSTGINAGNQKITNVSNGTENNDAVNLSQLNEVKTTAESKLGSFTVSNGSSSTATIAVNKDTDRFNIVGSNGIETTVDNRNINVRLDNDTKSKIDSALQTIAVSADGRSENIEKQDGISTINFANGNATTATLDGSSVKFNVNTDGTTIKIDGDQLKANTTSLEVENHKIKMPDNGESLVNASQIADAINKIGFIVKATQGEGEAENEEDKLIVAGETFNLEAGKNIKITHEDGKFTFATKDDVEFSTLKTTDTATIGGMLNANGGLTVAGSQKIDMGNNKITNVQAGSSNTDAVNIAQLKANTTTVRAGTNIAGVEESKTANGITYTINANGTNVSHSSTSASRLTVKNTQAGNNVTNFEVALTDSTIKSLDKADTAVQNFAVGAGNSAIANVTVNQTDNSFNIVGSDGVATAVDNRNITVKLDEATKANLTKANTALQTIALQANNENALTLDKSSDTSTIKFINGNATTAKINADNKAVSFDVNVDNTTIKIEGTNLTANTTSLTVSGGKITTPANGGNLMNATEITNAINAVGFNVRENSSQKKLVKAGEALDFNNTTTISANVTDTGVITFNANTGAVSGGNGAAFSSSDNTKLATIETVVNALNNVSFGLNLTASGGTVTGDHGTNGDKILHNESLNITAGTGIDLTKADNGFTIAVNSSVVEKGTLSKETVNGKETGKITNESADENKVATVGNVKQAINDAGFIVKASQGTDGIVESGADELITAGETLDLTAGKNIKISQANGNFTFATKDDVSFNNVTVSNNISTANLTATNSIKLGTVEITTTGINAGNKAITNISSSAPVYTNEANSVKNGLLNLSNLGDKANNAATVGDLAKLGWIISADKTTGETTTTAYSANVTNANEVKFVGTGLANVSGKTSDANVRTITIHVDENAIATTDLTNHTTLTDNNVGKITVDETHKSKFVTAENISTAINSAGFVLKGNDEAKDVITAGDSLNFKNGTATTAVVDTNGNVQFDVVTQNSTSANITTTNGIKVDVRTHNTKTANTTVGENGVQVDVISAGGRATAVNTTASGVSFDVKTDETTIKVADNNLTANTTTITVADNGEVTVPTDTAGNLVNASTVATALQKTGFTLKTSATTEGQNTSSDTLKNNGDKINTGETVTFKAGKNLSILQEDNGNITYSTKESVQFNESVTVGTNSNTITLTGSNGSITTTGTATFGGKLTANGGLEVKNGQTVNMGNNKITQVQAGDADTDAVNVSQLRHNVTTLQNNIDAKADKNRTYTFTVNGEATQKAKDWTLSENNTINFNAKADELAVSTDQNGNITYSFSETFRDRVNTIESDIVNIETDISNLNGFVTSNRQEIDSNANEIAKGLNVAVANTGTGTSSGQNNNLKLGETITLTAGNNVHITKEIGKFTISADSTNVSVTTGNTDYLTINKGEKDSQNITDFAVSFTEKTRTAIDNAVQILTASVNKSDATGDNPVTKPTNISSNINFANGTATTAKIADGAVKFDVNTDSTTIKVNSADGNNRIEANTTTLTAISTGSNIGKINELDATAANAGNLMNASEIAKAINSAGFTATATQGTDGELGNAVTTELINAGDTLELEAGKNIKITQTNGKFSFATKENVDFTNVNVSNVLNVGSSNNLITLNGANGSIKTGSTTLDGTSLTTNTVTVPAGTSNIVINSSGINAGNQKITKVKAGTEDTDAVNLSQLNATQSATTWTIAGNNGTDNVEGKIGNEKVTFVNGTASTAVVTIGDDKNATVKFDVKAKNGNATTATVENDGVKFDVNTDGTTIKLSSDNKRIEANTTNIAINADGTAQKADSSANDGNLVNVSTVINALNTIGWNTNSTTANDGENNQNAQITAGKQVNFEVGKNLKLARIVSDGNVTYTYETDDDVSFNSVTTDILQANDALTIGDTLMTSADGTLKVASLGGKTVKITNVADGTISADSTDAVNGSQLYNVQNTLVDQGLNFAGNTGSNIHKDLGETLTIKGDLADDKSASAKNIRVDSNGNELVVKISENPEFNSVNATSNITVGSSDKLIKLDGDKGHLTVGTADNQIKLDATNGKITTGNVTVSGKHISVGSDVTLTENAVRVGNTIVADDMVAFHNDSNDVNKTVMLTASGLNNGGNKIINVANGTISATSTDAVNGSQLFAESAKAKTEVKTTTTDTLDVSQETGSAGQTIYNVTTKTGTISVDNKGNVSNVSQNALATVGNVADALAKIGFTIKGDTGTDFVKTGHTVNYVGGKGLTSNITTDNGVTNVSFKVNTDNTTTQIVDDQVVAKTTALANNEVTGVVSIENGEGANLVNASTVMQAVNNAGFIVSSSNVGGGEVDEDGVENKLVKTGNAVILDAGKNIKISQSGSLFSIATMENVSFTNANVSEVLAVGADDKLITLDGKNGALTVGTADNEIKLDATNGHITTGNVTVSGKRIDVGANVTLTENAVRVGNTIVADDMVAFHNDSNDVNKTVMLTASGLNNGGNKIINLANGTISADSTDAVNGSQLYNVQNTLVDQGLNFAGNTGSNIHKDLGETLTIKGDLADDKSASAKNIRVDSESGALVVKISENPEFNNVTATSNITVGSGDKLIKLDGDEGHLTVGAGDKQIKLDATNGNITTGNSTLSATGLTVKDGDKVATTVDKNGVKVGENTTLSATGLSVNDTSLTADGVKVGDQVALTKDKLKVGDVTVNTDNIRLGNVTVNKENVTVGNVTVGTDSIQLGDKVTLDKSGLTAGNVSLTESGINAGDLKITNVADGDISPTSKDAVNGSQLYNVQSNIVNKGLDFAGNTGSNIHKDLGETLTIKGSLDNGSSASAKNIRVDSESGALVVKISENPEFNSVTATSNMTVGSGNNLIKLDGANGNITTGNSTLSATGLSVKEGDNVATTVDKDGVKVGENVALTDTGITAGDVSLTTDGLTVPTSVAGQNVVINQSGISAGGMTITNVSDGIYDTDAVNVSQLETAKAEAITATTWKINTDGNAVAQDVANQTVTVKHGKNTQVSAVQKDANGNYSYEIDVTGLPMEYVDADGDILVNVGGKFYKQTPASDGSLKPSSPAKVRISSTTPMQLTNVADGTISAESKDAVNGSQLHQVIQNGLNFSANTGDNIHKNIGDTITIQGGLANDQSASSKNIRVDSNGRELIVKISDNPEFNSVKVGDITLATTTDIDNYAPALSVTQNGADTRITNVAAGVKANDAVNVSQLVESNTVIHHRINNLDNKVHQMDKDLRAGVASAVATGLLPQAYLPGDRLVGASVGTYKDSSAIAVGFSQISDNGKFILRLSGSTTREGDVSGGAAVGMRF